MASPFEKGPLQLLYERLYVVVVVTAAAMIVAWAVSQAVTPVFRSQARCYLPTHNDAISLTTEEGNLPTQPKLPVANVPTQDALKGLIQGEDLRQRVAATVEERNSVMLKKNVDFDIDKFNFLTITAWDPDANKAAEIAGAYLRFFQDKLEQQTKDRVRQNVAALNDQITSSEQRILELEEQKIALLEERGSVDFNTEFNQLAARKLALQNAIADLQVEIRANAESQEQVLEEIGALEEFARESYTFVANPRVQQLEAQIIDARTDLELLLQRFTRRHPDVEAKRTEIDQLEAALAVEEESIQGVESFARNDQRTLLERQSSDLRLRASALQVELAERRAELDEVLVELRAMPSFRVRLEALESRIAKARETLSNQRSRRDELEFYLDRRPSFLVVAETPTVPAEPTFPMTSINMAVAGALGFIFSLCMVIAMSRIAAFRQRVLW